MQETRAMSYILTPNLQRKNNKMNVVAITKDQTDTMQRILDRLVAEGAAHAALIVTYPDGEQVVLRAVCDQQTTAFQKASGFR